MPDEMPDSLLMADESGEQVPDNTCPECLAVGVTRSFDKPVRLGAHRRGAHGVAGVKREKKAPKPPKESPVNLNLNVTGKGGNTAEAKQIAKTAKGAASFMNLCAAGAVAVGQQADAVILAENAQLWGNAVGDLSQYQPWLQKIFAPTGEVSGQFAAWAALAAVTAAIAMPIAMNHDVIKPETAQKFGIAAGAGASFATATVADAPATS